MDTGFTDTIDTSSPLVVTESSVYLKKYEGKVQLHCDQVEGEQQQTRSNAISEEAKTPTRAIVAPPLQNATEERAKITTSNSNLNEYDTNLSLRDRVSLAVRKTMEDNNDQQNQQPLLGVVRWDVKVYRGGIHI